MYKLLSYPLGAYTPAWPGTPQVKLEKLLQIAKGDVAHTTILHIHNHIGTHFDAPNHYLADGTPIGSLDLERFIYERPLLLDIPKEACEKITADDLAPYEKSIAACDALFLRTGFSRYRESDPERYEQKGPSIGSECAAWLVRRFPGLKAIAVDFVSLASYSDQDDGNEAHRILFGRDSENFICGIEDANFDGIDPQALQRAFALPILAEGLDSSVISFLAELK